MQICIALELTYFLGQTGILFYAFPPASPNPPITLSHQENTIGVRIAICQFGTRNPFARK